MLPQYSQIPLILILLTTLVLLLSPKFVWALIALGVQYFAAFWIVSLAIPLGLSLVKFLVGLMIVALFVSILRQAEPAWKSEDSNSGLLIKVGVMIVIWIVVLISIPQAQMWFPVQPVVLTGSLLLIMSGFIQIGLTHHVLRICVGLLTLMSGFELLNSAIELSVLVSALLAIINVGIALVGFFLVLRSYENVEVLE